MFKVKTITIALIVMLFAFYLVGDLATTIWLIDNHPRGIEDEINPVGIMIYNNNGVLGLIFIKLIMFTLIVVSILVAESFKRKKMDGSS